MKIIPAIDIINGQCVRLSQGDYSKMTTYDENPVRMAKKIEDAGFKHLHLVDLDGAKSNGVKNDAVVKNILAETNLIVDFGGGIKSEKDLKLILDLGVNEVTVGSLAIKKPDQFIAWMKEYGTEKLIFGADCKDEMLASNGWLDGSDISVFTMIDLFYKNGLKKVICTDISKDGMLAGPSTELYQKILKQFDIQLIASGGVTSYDDVETMKNIGCSGAIVGKALYEGRMDFKKLASLC
ncbi:MAG: phosphoribosylformimino-5-aminoimidazole carboxamide ribotide isomerase [Psychromonas sp.]|jgi:phosphoribosylformimino-5-aminoimidazole carboxamide ribotide isomerase